MEQTGNRRGVRPGDPPGKPQAGTSQRAPEKGVSVMSAPSDGPQVAGKVASLWRYPVKSMLGEELNASEVTTWGLLGDRAYALLDTADGKVASAKNPRRWPQLLDFRAAFVDFPRPGAPLPPVRITLPDGKVVTSEHGDLHQVLSRAL